MAKVLIFKWKLEFRKICVSKQLYSSQLLNILKKFSDDIGDVNEHGF